jgi:hypothetical protein
MTTYFRTRPWVGRILSLALPFLALTFVVSFSAPCFAQSSSLTCSWPVKVSGQGITNVAFPDTDATYWVMPIDTTQWSAMVIKGQFPKSRFFSFVTYLGKGGAVDSIIDANIEPDAGSTNAFMLPGSTGEAQNYTVTIDANATDSTNHIHWGNTGLAFVIYRIYVADKGSSEEAGVPLPEVALVNSSGQASPIQTCPSFLPATQLPGLSTLLEDVIAAKGGGKSCPGNQAPQAEVTFTLNSTPGRFFPNPATKYVAARGLCFQPGKIIVVRGQAGVFPDTYNDSSIFQPAIPGAIQMRYWSMCNNDEVLPGPVVDCQADHATALDDQGFYTYIISASVSGAAAPPSWLPEGSKWIPWGNPAVSKALLFREMLPMPSFSLTGSYLPKAVYCDQDLFIREGWQGCFQAAGVAAPQVWRDRRLLHFRPAAA